MFIEKIAECPAFHMKLILSYFYYNIIIHSFNISLILPFSIFYL